MIEKKRTFEEEMDLLEKCAERLRDEDVPLEEAIHSFEEGITKTVNWYKNNIVWWQKLKNR